MKYLEEWRELFSFWRNDLISGITVGIVALPLALGFAITTGAPPSAGLATAIIAGFVAALFGGSKYQVSGPTGAMTVVLVPIVTTYGIQSLVWLGIAAGVIIICFALFGFGRYIEKVPWSVMEGFTLGIAIIIALQQIPFVFDVQKSSGTHTFTVAISTIFTAFKEDLHFASISIAILTLVIKRVWPRIKGFLGAKIHLPASFVAISLVTLITQIFSIDVTQIGDLPRTLSLTKNFSFVNISALAFIYSALIIALLGAIESLLSARVADSMANKVINHDQAPHNPKKELIGQGLATITSALAGGLPATGAIARTSVNVHSGARTRLSAIIHALFLLSVVLFLAPIVELIPTAALAGVLIGTSLRIANPRSVKEALQSTYQFRIVYLATAISVVLIDLIWGVLIGIILEWILNKRS